MPALPVEATAHVAKESERWSVSKLQAKIGRSDFAGEAQLERNKPETTAGGRSVLHATLTSEHANIADFRGASSSTTAPGKVPATAGTLDAEIDLKIASIDGLPIGVTRVSAHAALREGRWAVDPAAFTIAGGRASGKLVAETGSGTAAYQVDLRLQGLQIDQLARAAPPLQALAGALDARIAMRSRGDSFASLASAAAGSLQAELVRATIPDALDAKLGLDGGRLLRAKLAADDARTPITCSALDLRFEAGRGTARRLAFETPHVALAGAGWIDLGRGSLDLLLTPHRKQTALLALDRAVQVSGALKAPKVALAAPDGARAGEPCVGGSVQ